MFTLCISKSKQSIYSEPDEIGNMPFIVIFMSVFFQTRVCIRGCNINAKLYTTLSEKCSFSSEDVILILNCQLHYQRNVHFLQENFVFAKF